MTIRHFLVTFLKYGSTVGQTYTQHAIIITHISLPHCKPMWDIITVDHDLQKKNASPMHWLHTFSTRTPSCVKIKDFHKDRPINLTLSSHRLHTREEMHSLMSHNLYQFETGYLISLVVFRLPATPVLNSAFLSWVYIYFFFPTVNGGLLGFWAGVPGWLLGFPSWCGLSPLI